MINNVYVVHVVTVDDDKSEDDDDGDGDENNDDEDEDDDDDTVNMGANDDVIKSNQMKDDVLINK